MEKYFVNTAQLNVRSTTEVASDNIIARLQKFRIVDLVEKTLSDWWKIRFLDGTENMEGYVASRFLLLLAEAPQIVESVKAVHFPRDPRSNLNSKLLMHVPMGDSSIEFRDMGTIEIRKQSIRSLIDKLDVAVSLRYRRTEKNTFCNIYAYDFCYFAGAYLPRVWWNGKAISLLTQGQAVEVKYADTVYELNANALHDWLLEWGNDFGWKRVRDVDTFQNLINENGGIGLICAKRTDSSKSGHISAVVPETSQIKATRLNGKIAYPLQSQAGANNFKYFSIEQRSWWTRSKFASFVFFYHD